MTDAAESLDLPLLEMAGRIQGGSLSPVALTEAALERIGRIGPKLNCFVTVTPEVARETARRAEDEIRRGRRRGPLHGIPYGLKDNIDTKGIRTTWGALPYANRVADADATAVVRLRQAGAVLVGKLSLTELAMGVSAADAAVNGACRNPWDASRWTGGSSSGPASAVAARLVAFALGTDTMGSLLSPAAFCGVTAFRPTYGVVSKAGVLPLAFTLDKVGPMCRTAQDCAAVLSVLAGPDRLDPASIPTPRGLAAVQPRAAVGLRAAVLPFPPGLSVRPDIEVLFEEALATLEAGGISLDPAPLPDMPWAEVADVIVAAETDVAFEDLIRTGRTRELSDPLHHGRDWQHLEGRPSDYVKAMAVRTEMQRAMHAFFQRYDLIVSPNTPVLPPFVDQPIPQIGGDRMRVAGNLLGLPAAAVPMGFVTPEKLPVSLAIAGRPTEDAKVLSAAALYQSRTRWHAERPPIL